MSSTGHSPLCSTRWDRVTILSARLPHKDGKPGPEFDHLALRVDLEQPWLVDVGFGDCFLEPLLLVRDIEQKQDHATFRIGEASTYFNVERQQPGDFWKTEYLFTLTPCYLEEFAEMCHFQQASPDSHFTQNRLCTRAMSNGRVTLSGMKLIVTATGNRQERLQASDGEWREVLMQHFGLVLPP